MKILIVLGSPYIPQYSGGVESSTHDLALDLQRRGHDVSVLCLLTTEGGLSGLAIRALRKLSRSPFPADRWLGYPVYRQWHVVPSVPSAVRELSPDLAIVQIGESVPLSAEFAACGVPVLFYFHTVITEELGGDPSTLRNVEFIANSKFTAGFYRKLYGVDSTVIPPLFRAERYIAPRKPANVTFVNPHVLKGVEVAVKVAELCPEIPFCFVESWTLGREAAKAFRARLARLPNAAFRRRTEDMKSVYGKAKIMLVPSTCEEAWGRVVTEAHFNGIPAVASNRGGLPEAVGPGGILLDPDGPIEGWVQAVRRLWHDDGYYAELSAAALAYAMRPELDPDRQIDTLLAAADRVIERQGIAQGSRAE